MSDKKMLANTYNKLIKNACVMEIKVFENMGELYQSVAQFYVEFLNKKPNSVLGLATGSTPIPLYKNLVSAYQQGQVSFKDVITFNLDEYIGLSNTHEASYFSFMRKNLFNHIDIKLENTHLPSGTLEPEIGIKQFQDVFSTYQVDIQLLGLGSNGHIGFNEPGTSFESTTHMTYLAESTIKDNSRMFNTIDEVPTKSITMGIKDIMKVKEIVIIAVGKSKADAVYQMINGPVDENLPASILQKHPKVTVYLDQAAAALL